MWLIWKREVFTINYILSDMNQYLPHLTQVWYMGTWLDYSLKLKFTGRWLRLLKRMPGSFPKLFWSALLIGILHLQMCCPRREYHFLWFYTRDSDFFPWIWIWVRWSENVRLLKEWCQGKSQIGPSPSGIKSCTCLAILGNLGYRSPANIMAGLLRGGTGRCRKYEFTYL